MKTPDGMTEAEVLAAIEEAVTMHSSKFTFGVWGIEDMQQEGRMECLKALPKYDPRCGPDGKPTRPLANFLQRHVLYRLSNVRRKYCRRTDPPCAICHAGEHARHADGQVCKSYRAWRKLNDTKADLACPQGLDGVPDEHEDSLKEPDEAYGLAVLDEAVAKIDAALDPALRTDFLRLKAGETLPAGRRDAVLDAVRTILGVENDE